MEDFRRSDLLEYPGFAFREALVNAVAHRGYALEDSLAQIRPFADRLEVQSHGGLGGHLTVDSMVYEQHTRNPHLMPLLEDAGYVECRGLGVDQMVRAMEQAGQDPPVFENRGTSSRVALLARPARLPLPDLHGPGLNDRQVRAVGYLQANDRLTNREYQSLFGVSERTAVYDLQGLVEAGLALPVSSGRGRHNILRD